MINRRYVDALYLLVLGTAFGAVLLLGVIDAPVIFNSKLFFGKEILSHYEEGMLMSELFRRFTYFGYFLVIVIVAYEGYLFKLFIRDQIAFMSASIAVFSTLLFNAVYTPKILTLQHLGEEATQSDTFANLHMASEIDFKILAISLMILFIRRVILIGVKK
jgi:hypothetical protein